MPQFDKITFFNQIFWLIFTFLFFYFILLRRFLPKISAVLKLRTKKYLKGNSYSELSGLEITNIYNKSSKFLTKFSSSFRRSLLTKFANKEFWLKTSQLEFSNITRIQKFYLIHFSGISPKKLI